MSRKFIYDKNDKLVDFIFSEDEKDDIKIIEKKFQENGISSILVEDTKIDRFIFYYIIPKTCKIESLREELFGTGRKTENAARNGYFGVIDVEGKVYSKVELIKSLV